MRRPITLIAIAVLAAACGQAAASELTYELAAAAETSKSDIDSLPSGLAARVAALEGATSTNASSIEELHTHVEELSDLIVQLQNDIDALENASGLSATFQLRSRTVNLGGAMTDYTVECEPGETVTGGGYYFVGLGTDFSTAYSIGHSSRPAGDLSGWILSARGPDEIDSPTVVYAICASSAD